MEQRILVLSSFSALQFWLSPNSSKPRFSIEKRELVTLPQHCKSIADREYVSALAEEYRLALPLHAMVSRAADRLDSRLIKAHVQPIGIPEDSFIKIDNSFYICSPELCFLQVAASALSMVKLTEIAVNLCAQYVVNKDAEYLQQQRNPITNTSSIKEYLNNSKKVMGMEKSRQAMHYTLDGSNSPIESKLAVLAMLPLFKGGFAEGGLELNYDVKLSAAAAALLGRPTCCCDGVWKKDKVIMEYDSKLVHLSPERHAYDKRRATALTLSGYKVISVTERDVQNHQAIESLFRNIRIARGGQSRKARMEKYEHVRWETVHELFFRKKEIAPGFVL